MLTVVIWAFNVTVTKYILGEGFQPLAFAAVRYGLAALAFVAITLCLEHSLRVGGRRSSARWESRSSRSSSTRSASSMRSSSRRRRRWRCSSGRCRSSPGCSARSPGSSMCRHGSGSPQVFPSWASALVALGSGGDVAGDLRGILLALGMVATWSVYSVAVAPLMRTYSPYRISTLVIGSDVCSGSPSPEAGSSPTRTSTSAGSCGSASRSPSSGRSC